MRIIFNLYIILIFCIFSLPGIGQDTTCVGPVAQLEWKYWLGLSGSDIDILYDHQYFPQSPDGKLNVSNIISPSNFDEYFGSSVTGFIKVPESGIYRFNITSDNKSEFYLSTDTDPLNKSLICYCPGPTQADQHGKYNQQTSADISLTAGSYIYFEMNLKERTGYDHAQVFWRTPSQSGNAWQEFPSNILYAYTCDVECDVVGTPCDDGNPNTIDDRADGHCNCFGVPATNTNNCIGDRGEIQTLYYDNIGGVDIHWLRNNPNFPLLPDRVSTFDRIFMPGDYGDEYGSYIRGYINPPVTGLYVFNLVSNHSSEFYLSTDDQIPDSLDLICHIDGFCSLGQHYKYESQTSDSLYLESDKIYYFEILHKEKFNSDHVALYWRTPYAQTELWRIVDHIYLHKYACDLACLPAGTPCDDGDDQTEDDTINSNCDCVGTPCGGPCPEPVTYIPTDACNLENEHSHLEMDSWLSCQKTMNPNTIHGNSHFIMYDFGQQYKINSIRYWNYNVMQLTSLGARNVVLDYSTDGIEWQTADMYLWAEAPGIPSYAGDTLPGVAGITAQYILLTLMDNRSDGTCIGFSEISFDMDICGQAGSYCDDGDPLTVYDMYNENCQCVGLRLDSINDCDPASLIIGSQAHSSGVYDARLLIKSKARVVENTLVQYVAKREIILDPGFKTELGSGFLAIPADCSSSNLNMDITIPNIVENELDSDHIQMEYSESQNRLNIIFDNKFPQTVSVCLIDEFGRKIWLIYPTFYPTTGVYQKIVPLQKVKPGQYTILVNSAHGESRSKFVRLP